jgi:hypothetical protein
MSPLMIADIGILAPLDEGGIAETLVDEFDIILPFNCLAGLLLVLRYSAGALPGDGSVPWAPWKALSIDPTIGRRPDEARAAPRAPSASHAPPSGSQAERLRGLGGAMAAGRARDDQCGTLWTAAWPAEAYQRSIPSESVNCLMSYGAKSRTIGAVIVFFDKRARHRLRRDLGRELYVSMEKKMQVYAVVRK